MDNHVVLPSTYSKREIGLTQHLVTGQYYDKQCQCSLLDFSPCNTETGDNKSVSVSARRQARGLSIVEACCNWLVYPRAKTALPKPLSFFFFCLITN